MPGFSLLSLTPLHLDKVINKIQEKSYFRLQQTCYDLKEFIQSSKYISVNLDSHWESAYDKATSTFEFYRNPNGASIKGEALYGTQLRLLRLHCPIENTEFETLCSVLEKNRITCIVFHVLGVTWTEEQCARIFRILKPEKVDFNSQRSNRYEALFPCKTVKAVDISLNFDDLLVLESLLSRFRYVALHGQVNSTPVAFLHWLLLLLHSKPLPDLHGFSFDLYCNSEILDCHEVIEQLSSGFGGQLPNFKVSAKSGYDIENLEALYVSVHMPSLKCTVTITNSHLIVIECSRINIIVYFIIFEESWENSA